MPMKAAPSSGRSHSRCTSHRLLSADLLALADEAAMDLIQKDDLRFAWRGLADGADLRQVVRAWASDPSHDSFTLQAYALVKRLRRAMQQSWREDVNDIARELAKRVY